jgi:hypothetical protein
LLDEVRFAPFFKSEFGLPTHRFHEADGSAIAITDDVSGASLPKATSGWIADGLTEVVAGGRMRFSVEPAQIIAVIERDGFFLVKREPD